MNYATLWEAVADELPDEAALWHEGRATTYRELDERAGRIAAGLRSAGVGRGDKVALYLYNGAAYLETLFAAFKLGAVPVTVNYRYKERELVDLLTDADARALIFHSSLGDRVVGVVGENRVRVALVVQDEPRAPVSGAIPYDELVASHDPLARSRRDGDDEVLLYTGGTTGLPKGVVWRQRDLFAAQVGTTYREVAGGAPPADLAGAVAIARALATDGLAPRFLPVVPLMHAAGLLNALGTLSLGGTVVFGPPRALDPAAVWRLVEQRRVTRMAIAGNAVGRPLADELERAAAAGRPYETSSLSRVTSSGVAWTDDVKRTFLEHGSMTLVEVLASSEGGPYAISRVSAVDELPSRYRLTPGTRVVDERGRPVEPGSGRVGTLAYSGPMPMGYNGDPEATAAVFKDMDGERHAIPGDLVQLAADGTVEFLGRGATVVNSGGEKIFPSEVEQALLSHPDVADCTIVGVPDERWGEAVTAVVEPRRGTATAGELIEHVGARLAGYKKPRHVVIVDRIPRGPNAKVDLRAVRALAIREVASGPAPLVG